MELTSALQQHFGFDHFREGQLDVIHHVLNNHSSLAIFPTGAGKSLCYQFTATQLDGVTLVVSPLLALIKDQIQFLESKGIAAASLDSTQSPEQNRAIIQAVRNGSINILMVSVERFNNENFRHFLREISIAMLVVDEAHCISEWGHNFRPDYLKLPDYQRQFAIPRVLLLTATAAQQVKQDMAAKFAIPAQQIVQTGFYRANLHLTVLASSPAIKNQQLLEQIQTSSGATATTGATIVYVTLQQTAEEVAHWLSGQGIQAQPYHAGLQTEQREAIQQAFMDNSLKVVVATIAFGMGIDKADIRTVIHYDLPKSIENYSQEIGRAGRDGLPAHCITLASLNGLSTLENFVYGDTPEPEAIEQVLNTIVQQTNANGLWEVQILPLSNETNVRQLPLKTLLVQLELMKVITPKYSYYAQYRYKFILSEQEVLEQFDENRAGFLTRVFAATRFKKIWGEPDFSLWSQEERDRAVKALDYLHQQGMIELESKQLTQAYQVISGQETSDQETSEIDVQAVTASLSHYFKDKEISEIGRLHNLLDFFQETRCLNHTLANYFGDNNAPSQCGHCSSCLGNSVSLLSRKVSRKLPRKVSKALPKKVPADQAEESNQFGDLLDIDIIKADLGELAEAFAKIKQDTMTLDCQCRFFAGITTPYLTKCRAKKLAGFGRYQTVRYAQIRNCLSNLFS